MSHLHECNSHRCTKPVMTNQDTLAHLVSSYVDNMPHKRTVDELSKHVHNALGPIPDGIRFSVAMNVLAKIMREEGVL